MGSGDRGDSIDALLDRAVAALNCGDRAAASALAGKVLAVDEGNTEAEDLLAAPAHAGEIRRLTILFADVVDSTVLSTRVEPETYRLLVGRYRDLVLEIVGRYEGHVGSTKGDGVLAVFGHPMAHEDDVRRAVQTGLEITREVAQLGAQAQRRFGIDIAVRVGVHRGPVYLDTAEDDVYGLAANLASRVAGLAPPGAVVVSDAVAPLIQNQFELETSEPAGVKGVDGLIAHHRVVAERTKAARVGRGPLVGRQREVARLERYWGRAQARTLSTPGVVFRGEPGIGKSRLAAVAVELVEGSGAVVLELAGSPFHTDAGLHPIRTLLEQRCGIGRLTDPTERLRYLEAEVTARGLDRVSVVPLLAPVLGIAAEHGYEPVAAEGRKLYELITQAVRAYLLACFGGEPGLVIAEDLHWFDLSTLEVLGSLVRAAQGGLLMVITGRPGGWLPDDWPVKLFDLQELTYEQTHELINALNPALSDNDRAAVAARCDGVPFYIEQVVNALTETRVPEALYEPLFARLRASANVVPVVEGAGVIGRHVDRALLCSVVDLSDDEVDDVLDQLEDASVLEPWGIDGWRFRHQLLREVACELTPPSVRRGLHAKVADALLHGVVGDPDWRLVAGHYEQAERFDESAAAYRRASAAARGRGALAEARTYLTQAIAGLERCQPAPDHDRREMALRLERGFLVGAIHGPSSPAVAIDFERCLQLCGTDPRDDELIATLVALTAFYAGRSDLSRATQVLGSLRAGLERGRSWLRPMVESMFGMLAWLRGEFDAAGTHLEAATAGLATADQHEMDAVQFLPNDLIASAHIHLALTHLLHGDLAGAEANVAHTARRVRQLGFPQGPVSLAYARFAESWVRLESGQFDRAAVLAADVTDQAERHGFDGWRVIGATQQASVRAVAALSADDLDRTGLSAHIAAVTRFADIWRAAKLNVYRTYFDGVLARLLIAAGQPEQAHAHLDAALALAQDTGMHFYDAELLRVRAHTHTNRGAHEADVSAALELARSQGATLFELRSALDDFELRGGSGRVALVDVVSRFPTDSAFPELARAHSALAR